MYNTDVEKSKQRIIGIDESKYICCCGCHVISCAKFFSIVSIVLSAVTLLSLFSCYYLSADYFIIQLIGNASWFKPETFNDFIYIAFHYSLASCGIDIILNGGVLYAIYGVLYGIYIIKPDVLLRYIMLKTFLFIMFGLYIIILANLFFTDNGLVFFWITVGAFVLGLFFIGCLFAYTFYRAYKYLKEVELRRYATVDQNDL